MVAVTVVCIRELLREILRFVGWRDKGGAVGSGQSGDRGAWFGAVVAWWELWGDAWCAVGIMIEK
jgi:hypothetical protein